MELSLDESNYKKAENFFSMYDFETMVGDTTQKYYLGKNSKPKRCRFCNKTADEVSFRMDAHVIPQFMGNRNLLSYFECDECNRKFSKYEDSFANFIGASRTIAQIPGQGKNKVPKFKDPKTGLTIELGENSLEMAFIEGSEEIIFNESTNKLIVKTKRPSYIPIHITKIMLKIAICLVKEEELEDHKRTLEFINHDKNDKRFEGNELLKIKAYFMPGPPKFPKPFAQLYTKKKNIKELVPNKHIILYYANYIFQLALPFSKRDESLVGKEISFPIFPLFIDNSHFEKYGNYQFFTLDTTSSEKKVNDPHTLTFSYESLREADLSNASKK